MTIYILHLYYDLMNLYGEIGNIKALEKTLRNSKINVVIDNLSIGDEIDFSKYDLVYMGACTEENELIVLKDIVKYKNKIKEYIKNNKFFIATGNSYELFGKSIENNGKHLGLNIFPYESKIIDKRIVGDSIVSSNFINDKIIGFQNRGSVNNNKDCMFKIINGVGDDGGIRYNNFFGTYLLGPILVRNPKLQEYIVTNLIINKDVRYAIKGLNFELDTKAYNSYMSEYYKEN